MTTTANNQLAVREIPAAALAIQAEQTAWDKMQLAALGQLGLKDAPEGDLAVFLHVSQRTRLDPFARQIYMIGRREKTREQDRNGKWTDVWGVKYTIQTGIEGFRVIRGRAEREEGVRGILGRPVYYDAELKEYKAWVSPRPPAAVEMTYTVRDRNGTETPYTSILRFSEYVQTRDDNGSRVPVAQWAAKPVHMLEKCTEADVYRKAFPQDFSGVELEDAMPSADPGTAQPERPQPPVGDLRQRAAAQTAAEVVDVKPERAAPARVRTARPASPAPSPDERAKSPAEVIGEHLERLNWDSGRDARLRVTSRLARRKAVIGSTSELSPAEQGQVIGQLAGLTTREQLAALYEDLAIGDDPREEAESGE